MVLKKKLTLTLVKMVRKTFFRTGDVCHDCGSSGETERATLNPAKTAGDSQPRSRVQGQWMEKY